LLYNLTGNKGHLSAVAIGQSKVYPNSEISANYQIIQEVSTEIAIFMTVATSLAQTYIHFFHYHLIK